MARPTRMRRDCQHPRANHQHGTHLAYRKDDCRCPECMAAARRDAKLTAYRTRHGTHTYVDADRARRHVLALLDQLTVGQVERRSGVHRTSIRVLIGDFPDRPPSKRITGQTERALLAVTPELVGPEVQGLVDRTGTRRRMQALVALGHPIAHLTRRLNMSNRTGWMLIDDRNTAQVTVATRDKVCEAYAQLSMTVTQGRHATRARNIAADRGWVPPLAWDDESLDDPAARPAAGGSRWRRRGPCTVEDVVELVEAGVCTIDELCRRLHRTPMALEAVLRRSGRRDLWRTLAKPDDYRAVRRAA